MQPIEGVVPRGSSWMMLIGGIVLLLGVFLAGWLSPSPTPAVRTLDLGESVSTDVSAEAGRYVVVVITLRDPAPGDRITRFIQTPYGTRGSGTGAGAGEMTSLTLAQETGIYTVVIQNSGVRADSRAVTVEYTLTTTSRAEMMLTAVGPTVVIAGFFLVVGGLGLRFAWRGLRGYWKS